MDEKPEEVPLSTRVDLTTDEPLTPEVDVDEIDFWLERIFNQQQPLTLEDLLPDAETDEAWKELSAEEQQRRIEQALGSLPPLQREAFLLAFVEGFDTMEIAMLQGRSEDEVKNDLQAARKQLADRLMSEQPAQ